MLESLDAVTSCLGLGILSVSGGAKEEAWIEEKARFWRCFMGLDFVWWRVKRRGGR